MPDEESSPPPPECFICTESEPAPRRSACKCTDRYVHDACLTRMLETSLHNGCPVCLVPHANVSLRSRVVGVDAFSRGGLVFAALVAASAMLVGALFTWHIYCCREYQISGSEEFFVHIAAIIMAISSMACFAFAGSECVDAGPRALVSSVVVYERTARVGK